jgi:hypothetical protein
VKRFDERHISQGRSGTQANLDVPIKAGHITKEAPAGRISTAPAACK